MSKKLLALLLALVMLFSLAACSSSDEGESSGEGTGETAGGETEEFKVTKENVKVGFIYIGDVNDGGYTQAHDKGRLALEAAGIPCLYKENIPESAEVETAARELIDMGCNIIYATSFGHGEYLANVAREYPDLYFGHGTSRLTEANMCNYMGRMIEGRYLAGIVAGLATKNNHIGYVYAMPQSECIRGINAFTLGAQSVNPDVKVEVLLTNTWYDVAVEKQAAIELLNRGVDVMAQHQDSTACQVAAQEAGALCIGYNTPTPDAAPEAYLTAPIFHWEKFYTDNVQSVLDGTWTNGSYWEGLAAGWVDLDTLSALAPEGAQEAVDAARKAIESGELKLFSGDVYGQDGTVKATDMTDDEIYNMEWFVQGVVGTLPTA